MLKSTLTAKGQTTLPKRVRDVLGLAPGDKIHFLVVGEEVRILPSRKVQSLAGMLRHDGPAVDVDAMDAAVAAEKDARARR